MNIEDMNPKDQEIIFQKRREEIYKRGQAAKGLLGSRYFKRFYNEEVEECIKGFEGLPQDATLEQYKHVHTRFIVVRSLMDRLESAVSHMEGERLNEASEKSISDETNI